MDGPWQECANFAARIGVPVGVVEFSSAGRRSAWGARQGGAGRPRGAAALPSDPQREWERLRQLEPYLRLHLKLQPDFQQDVQEPHAHSDSPLADEAHRALRALIFDPLCRSAICLLRDEGWIPGERCGDASRWLADIALERAHGYLLTRNLVELCRSNPLALARSIQRRHLSHLYGRPHHGIPLTYLEEDRDIPEERPGPEDVSIIRQRRILAERCLTELTNQKMKRAFCLWVERCDEDVTVQEVAEALNQTRTAVLTYLKRARDKLKACIERHEVLT